MIVPKFVKLIQLKNSTGLPPKMDALSMSGMATELIRVASRMDTKLVTRASLLLRGFIKEISTPTNMAMRIFVMVDIAAATNCKNVLTRMSLLKV